jgi:hypothetical protein
MLYQKANGEAWSLPYNPLLSILLIPNLEHFRVELQAVAQLPGLGMLGDAQFKEFSSIITQICVVGLSEHGMNNHPTMVLAARVLGKVVGLGVSANACGGAIVHRAVSMTWSRGGCSRQKRSFQGVHVNVCRTPELCSDTKVADHG